MPSLIGSNALKTWRIALNKQYTKVPPTHPIIDTWSVEKTIVGVVRSVNYYDASMLNCAYIKSKLTVPIIKPYDRTVIITLGQSFNKTVTSTTVAIPKYHSVVLFELPVLSTSQAKTLSNFEQLIGSASPLVTCNSDSNVHCTTQCKCRQVCHE